jgi:hypothetical protein
MDAVFANGKWFRSLVEVIEVCYQIAAIKQERFVAGISKEEAKLEL